MSIETQDNVIQSGLNSKSEVADSANGINERDSVPAAASELYYSLASHVEEEEDDNSSGYDEVTILGATQLQGGRENNCASEYYGNATVLGTTAPRNEEELLVSVDYDDVTILGAKAPRDEEELSGDYDDVTILGTTVPREDQSYEYENGDFDPNKIDTDVTTGTGGDANTWNTVLPTLSEATAQKEVQQVREQRIATEPVRDTKATPAMVKSVRKTSDSVAHVNLIVATSTSRALSAIKTKEIATTTTAAPVEYTNVTAARKISPAAGQQPKVERNRNSTTDELTDSMYDMVKYEHGGQLETPTSHDSPSSGDERTYENFASNDESVTKQSELYYNQRELVRGKDETYYDQRDVRDDSDESDNGSYYNIMIESRPVT